MPYTLYDTLRQIDPYVQLNDGFTVEPVIKKLADSDLRDLTEYVLLLDAVGRLMIYELDFRGFIMRPPVFIEHKATDPSPAERHRSVPVDFGSAVAGYA